MSEVSSEALTWGMFEVSPDQKRILTPHKDKGLALFTIASGELTHLLPEAELKLWPTWRTDEEISCATRIDPDASREEKSDVVLLNVDTSQIRPISGNWPEDVRDRLIDPKDEQKSPGATTSEDANDEK